MTTINTPAVRHLTAEELLARQAVIDAHKARLADGGAGDARSEERSSSEDTSDAAYTALHAAHEAEEHLKFTATANAGESACCALHEACAMCTLQPACTVVVAADLWLCQGLGVAKQQEGYRTQVDFILGRHGLQLHPRQILGVQAWTARMLHACRTPGTCNSGRQHMHA